MDATREQVLRFRIHAQQLDAGRAQRDAAILDLGVQDTGPDGAAWALAVRRCTIDPDDLFLAWTIRGAPHAYRRAEAAGVAAATAPLDEADAAKRVFDAARPLRAADIPVVDALAHVADTMRDIVTRPTVKGDLSGALTDRLDDPYLRWCNPCQATHSHEQTFRIASLAAGLELEPGTSPPVLRRIPGWRDPAARVPAHLDPIRGVLRFLGPATVADVAGYLDSPTKVVRAHWPDDAVAVDVEGTERFVLDDDRAALRRPPEVEGVRLLGPFDLFLQGRDRELVVPDAAARKDLWRTLGRPGAVLDGAELVGSWRPRASGQKLRIAVEMWSGRAEVPDGVEEQAERLAEFRGVTFAGFA